MPALSPPDPPLSDGVVALRPPRPGDADAAVAALRDPDVVRWTRVPGDYSHADFADWLAVAAAGWARGDHLSLLIVDADEDERILGSVGLHAVGTSRPDMGYWVARDARGRGVAARAVRLLRDWAAPALGLGRIDVLVHPDNAPSLRTAERAGFARTGEYRPSPREPGGDPLVVLSWPEDAAGGAG